MCVALVISAMSPGCSISSDDSFEDTWWTSLDEGECFELEYLEGTRVDLVSGATEVACSTPHEFEVFKVFQAADGEYPGIDSMMDVARVGCREAFVDFIGRDYELSELHIYWLYPDPVTWRDGDRRVTCSLHLKGEKLTGSQRDSRR